MTWRVLVYTVIFSLCGNPSLSNGPIGDMPVREYTVDSLEKWVTQGRRDFGYVLYNKVFEEDMGLGSRLAKRGD